VQASKQASKHFRNRVDLEGLAQARPNYIYMYMYIVCLLHTLIATWPFIFSISPRRADISDDLPAPTCPTTATSSPGFTLTLILRGRGGGGGGGGRGGGGRGGGE